MVGGGGCICNYYFHVILMYVLATILLYIQFPFFFKGNYINPIIPFKLLIFDWKTFEISLSFIWFSVLFLCVHYSNSTCMMLLLSTHSLDLYMWGETDHPASGPPASSSITPKGSVHKSRGDNVVCMWVQLKR